MTSPSFFPSASLDHAAAGITAGAVSTITLHPLDVVKTRLQVDSTRASTILGNAFRIARNVWSKQGASGFYRGLSPNVVGATSSWGLYFFFYNHLKESMRVHLSEPNDVNASTQLRSLTAGQHWLASGGAGAATAIITNPIWVVKTRMCTSATGESGAYTGLTDGLYQILKTEGPVGLYRGMLPGLLGVSHGAMQFMAYEEMKKWRAAKKGTSAEREKLSTIESIGMAAASKLFATVTTYPFQVLKSRLQAHGSIYSGVVDCVKKMYRSEGLSSFYKGLVPNVVRVMPGTCVTFAVYEATSGWFKQNPRHNLSEND